MIWTSIESFSLKGLEIVKIHVLISFAINKWHIVSVAVNWPQYLSLLKTARPKFSFPRFPTIELDPAIKLSGVIWTFWLELFSKFWDELFRLEVSEESLLSSEELLFPLSCLFSSERAVKFRSCCF